jgi:hypothetical protein
MAPRQWMRKMKVGKTGFMEAYRAVREMRDRYPNKAVTFYAQQYPDYGWAILLAGGSLPNIPINRQTATPLQLSLLKDLGRMTPVDCKDGLMIGDSEKGYLIYTLGKRLSAHIAMGKYNVYAIDKQNGNITLLKKSLTLKDSYTPDDIHENQVIWLRRL